MLSKVLHKYILSIIFTLLLTIFSIFSFQLGREDLKNGGETEQTANKAQLYAKLCSPSSVFQG